MNRSNPSAGPDRVALIPSFARIRVPDIFLFVQVFPASVSTIYAQGIPQNGKM